MGGRSHLSEGSVRRPPIVKDRQSRLPFRLIVSVREGLHPAPPAILAVVATRSPRVVRPFVGFQDHGVHPSPAQRDEPLFRCCHQGGGDASPAAVRVYGQPVDGASPTIETGYDGSREKAVALCEKQGSWVPRDESRHPVVVVADARSFRGFAPEPQHGVDIGEAGAADVEITHGATQAEGRPARRTISARRSGRQSSASRMFKNAVPPTLPSGRGSASSAQMTFPWGV